MNNLNPIYTAELQEGFGKAVAKGIAGLGLGAAATLGGVRAGANGALQNTLLTKGTKMAQMAATHKQTLGQLANAHKQTLGQLANAQKANATYAHVMNNGGQIWSTNGVPFRPTVGDLKKVDVNPYSGKTTLNGQDLTMREITSTTPRVTTQVRKPQVTVGSDRSYSFGPQ